MKKLGLIIGIVSGCISLSAMGQETIYELNDPKGITTATTDNVKKGTDTNCVTYTFGFPGMQSDYGYCCLKKDTAHNINQMNSDVCSALLAGLQSKGGTDYFDYKKDFQTLSVITGKPLMKTNCSLYSSKRGFNEWGSNASVSCEYRPVTK